TGTEAPHAGDVDDQRGSATGRSAQPGAPGCDGQLQRRAQAGRRAHGPGVIDTSETTEGGTTPMTVGTVKWFNAKKGYGFIAPQSGNAGFAHASAIQDGGTLQDGQAVEFDITQGQKGPQATNVRAVATQDPPPAGAISCRGTRGDWPIVRPAASQGRRPSWPHCCSPPPLPRRAMPLSPCAATSTPRPPVSSGST